jgi:iron complex transport system substrate-binding protein
MQYPDRTNMAHKIALIASSLLVFVACFSIRERYFPARAQRDSPIFADAKIGTVPYRRIVSMAPSITETLYVLGLSDRLVGVTRYCTYPPAVQKLPKVGGFFDPNFEAMVALKPELVILLEEHEQSLPGFQKLGLNTTIVCHKYIDGIIDSLRTIARVCGVEAQGRRVADDIQSRLDRVRKKTAHSKRPRVMIAIDRIQGSGGLVDVYIAGNDGYFDKMIELAGGENAYHRTLVRFPVVSTEGIMRINPDVIVDMVSGVDTEHFQPEQTLADWRSLTNVEAVKQHRIYAFNRDYAIVPGPRFIRFVEDLARLLHPEIDWNGT